MLKYLQFVCVEWVDLKRVINVSRTVVESVTTHVCLRGGMKTPGRMTTPPNQIRPSRQFIGT